MKVVTPEQIDYERSQLLRRWQRAFRRHPCWISGPPPQVARALSINVAERGMAIRRLHDKLGFCAKGSLDEGGLCAGAIFRTTDFINIPQGERSGRRVEQTVHIEHTVPTNVLADIVEQKIADQSSDILLAWLLKHSVTTAMRKGQDRDYLVGVSQSTTAFEKGGFHEGLPFQRYLKLFDAEETVWDVWNRKKIDASKFTFESHLQTVLSIMKEAGANEDFIKKIEAAAA